MLHQVTSTSKSSWSDKSLGLFYFQKFLNLQCLTDLFFAKHFFVIKWINRTHNARSLLFSIQKFDDPESSYLTRNFSQHFQVKTQTPYKSAIHLYLIISNLNFVLILQNQNCLFMLQKYDHSQALFPYLWQFICVADHLCVRN